MAARVAGTLPFLLLLVGATGCLGGDEEDRATVPRIVIPDPLHVLFTPGEPNEPPAELEVERAGGLFGVSSPTPREFPERVVRDGDSLYVSNLGNAWVLYGPADEGAHAWWASLLGWDIAALLAHDSFERTDDGSDDGIVAGRGIARVGTLALPFTITVRHRAGAFLDATVSVDDARETPHLVAPGSGVPFPVQVPTAAKPAAEVVRTDALAAPAHAFVAGLVSDYVRNHAGLVPDRVTPETLRLELLASGEPWPRNPYSNQALAAGEGSGQFLWEVCSTTTAYYGALGWDSLLFDQNWGSGVCPR